MLNTKTLFTVVGVLVVGALGVMTFDHVRRPASDALLRTEVLTTESLNQTEKILLVGAGNQLELVKDSSGSWQVGTQLTGGVAVPGDAAAIYGFLEGLTKTKYVELVATKKSSWESVGLDGTKSVKLVGKDGKDLLTLNLGKTRSAQPEQWRPAQYVSVGAGEKVYLVDQDVRGYTDANAWELKKLLDIKADQVKRVTFTPAAELSKQPVSMERETKELPFKIKDLGSHTENPGVLTNAGALLLDLSFSRRLDLSNEEAKTALAHPSRADVLLFDGREIEILSGRIGGKEIKHFVKITVKAGASNAQLDASAAQTNALMNVFAFEFPAHIGERFEKGLGDFIMPTPAAAEKTKEAKKGRS